MASSCSSSSMEPSSYEELIQRLSSSDNLSPVTRINQREFKTRMRKEEHINLCKTFLESQSSSSHLTHLYVSSGDDDESRVDCDVLHWYAILLRAAPSLKNLSFRLSRIGGGEGFNRITDWLRSSALKISHLGFAYNSIDHCGSGSMGVEVGLRHLAEILSISLLPLQSLSLVRIGMGAEGVVLLAESLHTNTTLLCLDLSFNYDIGYKGMHAIAQMLVHNTTLQSLYLTDMGLSPPLMKPLGIALAQNKTLQTLDISYNDEIGEEGMEFVFPYKAQIKHLKFRCAPRIFKAFASILRHNTTLTSLDLWRNRETKPSRVEELFKAIADNRFLETLDLFGCEAVRGAMVVSCILDSLQVHSWLTHLNIQDTPLEKQGHVAVIEAQLKRIQEENAMGLPRMQKAKPNRIRVFFCGLPGAGKTTLKNSMIHARKGKLHSMLYTLLHTLLHFANQTTRGIDIAHILFPKIIISLWDLAGQEDFYSFHDFMFPDISHVGNPSLFLILCKPFDNQGSQKPIECIGTEINYWLRFISSKSRQSDKFKPNVAIVFTHKDKQHNCSNVSSMQNIVNAIRVGFQARLALSDRVFHVNAKSSVSSYKILEYVHKTSSSVLESWPVTYSCCDQVNELLKEWKANHPCTPIMHVSEFIRLCSNIEDLIVTNPQSSTSASTLSMEHKIVLHALNNIGDILYLPDLEYIVVDLLWFCRDLIGQMVKYEGMARKNEEFIDWQEFVAIVSHSLSSKRDAREDPNIQAQLVVEIMKKMNLCFTRNTTNASTCDVFNPANLRPTMESQSWKLDIDNPNQTMLGRRLQCLDPNHTILTPNFFPQIQIALYNLFEGDRNFEFKIMKDFIGIIDNNYGMEIRLEFHGYGVDDVLNLATQHNNEYEYEHPLVYIDLLVRSKQSTATALYRLHMIVIKEIREFCAKWRGCQGVTLIEGILRPECVKEPQKYKIKQCVLVSTLEDSLMKFPASDIHIHQYVWKAFGLLGMVSNSTKELLGEEAFMQVIRKRMMNVQAIAAELSRAETWEAVLNGGAGTNEAIMIFHAPSEQDRSEEAIGNQHSIEDLIIRFDQMPEAWAGLAKFEDQMGEVLQAVEEMSRRLICIENKVVRELNEISAVLDIVNWQGASEQHRIPHLFYFTQRKGSICERVVKLMASIHCYHLRFLCEGLPPSSSSSTGNRPEHNNHHEVEDIYKGLSLVFPGSKRLEKAMPYLNKVLKAVTFMTKVGVHVIAGAGELVPDFAKLPALVFDAAVIDVASMQLEELGDPEWLELNRTRGPEQWLVDLLTENKCYSGNDIAQTFGLHRVKHRDTSKVAWLCQDHSNHPDFLPFPVYHT